MIGQELHMMASGFGTWRSLIEAERQTADSRLGDRVLPSEERAWVWLAQASAKVRSWSLAQWCDLWPEDEVALGAQHAIALLNVYKTWKPYRTALKAVPSPAMIRRERLAFEGLAVSWEWAWDQFTAAERAVGAAVGALRDHNPDALPEAPQRSLGLGVGWEHLESPVSSWTASDFRVSAAGAGEDVTATVALGRERWTLTLTHRDVHGAQWRETATGLLGHSCRMSTAAQLADKLLRDASRYAIA